MRSPLHRFLAGAVVALALVAAMPGLKAQATVTATTLSAALNSTTNTFTVASATNFVANSIAYIDREALVISAVSGTSITASRGAQGTRSAAHISGSAVFVGVPQYFYSTDVSGACTTTQQTALPHINIQSGNIFTCPNGSWVLQQAAGFPGPSFTLLAGQTYTASGALTVQPGVSFIGSGGALAMTIVNPTIQQNGMIMIIEASTAQAHTVTYTAGFNGGTTARDVATFGGAIGDNLMIYANSGVWWVISTRNVTFG